MPTHRVPTTRRVPTGRRVPSARRRRAGRLLAPALVTAALFPGTVAAASTDAGSEGATVVVDGPETPRTAADFLGSVGVNVHFEYTDTPYAQRYAEVRRLLVDSGIRHVRGGYLRAEDLARDGIRSNVVVDLGAGPDTTPEQIWEKVAPLVRSGAVDAVEGPNEPDLFWNRRGVVRTYQGKPHPEGPLLWQRDLWNLVKSDPTTEDVTVIGPSLGRHYDDGPKPWPEGSLAEISDWGSFHPYPGGNAFNPPRTYAGVDAYYANSDFPSNGLDVFPRNFAAWQPPFGDKPMAATETGYSTHDLGQSERTQGIYTPRIFLENFRLGVARTYTYEFLDEWDRPWDREANFGLLRHDLTPKPSYTAVQSLLRVIGDGGAMTGTDAGEVDYRLEVTPPEGYDPRYLHRVLLRRDDGSAVLALWHEVSANDVTGLASSPQQPPRELSHPPVRVDALLRDGVEATDVWQLDDAGRSVAVDGADGSDLSLDVTGQVTLIELSAAGDDGFPAAALLTGGIAVALALVAGGTVLVVRRRRAATDSSAGVG